MTTSESDRTESRRQARESLEAKGVKVLFEDNHLLCIAKPAGLLSQGGPEADTHITSLLDTYRREAEGKSGRAFVGLVHRLDRNVGGAMVVAKTSKAAGRLSESFRQRDAQIEKEYLAWVAGQMETSHGELEDRLRREARVTRGTFADDPEGREARLSWDLEARGRRACRLRVRLHTGVTHQIRAQMSLASHPILGDVKYGGRKGARLGLYAWRLAFPHPVGGARIEITAPVPEALRRLDQALGMKPKVARGR